MQVLDIVILSVFHAIKVRGRIVIHNWWCKLVAYIPFHYKYWYSVWGLHISEWGKNPKWLALIFNIIHYILWEEERKKKSIFPQTKISCINQQSFYWGIIPIYKYTVFVSMTISRGFLCVCLLMKLLMNVPAIWGQDSGDDI